MKTLNFFILSFVVFTLNGCESYQQTCIKEFDPKKIKKLEIKKEPIHRYGSKSYKLYGDKFKVRKKRNHFHQRGYASWYLGNSKNSITAINEKYDMYAMTAAHRSLPLPTYAIVTNLENNKRVIVRINDRGPFIKGRIIDLSYAAAHKLGMVKKGLVMVQIDTIDHYKNLG